MTAIPVSILVSDLLGKAAGSSNMVATVLNSAADVRSGNFTPEFMNSLRASFEAKNLVPTDVTETAIAFSKQIIDTQSNITDEINRNNNKFHLEGKEYDATTAGGQLVLNQYIARSQYAAGSVEKIVANIRDFEKNLAQLFG